MLKRKSHKKGSIHTEIENIYLFVVCNSNLVISLVEKTLWANVKLRFSYQAHNSISIVDKMKENGYVIIQRTLLIFLS